MAALLAGSALMNAAMAVASALSTLVAGDLLGAAWAGLPSCAGIAGTGLGALALSRLMQRRGRRAGLLAGYAAATAGAALAATGAAGQDITGLIAGLLLLGLGNAGAQLSRYAAAELYPAQRRGSAIGAVLWATTVGAVGGPLLLAPSGQAAAAVGWAAAAGPFLLAAVATVTAAGAAGLLPALRADAVAVRTRLRGLLRLPAARSAFAVMVTAQVIMVAVMTATPMAMQMGGQGLAAVGAVLSAHTFGMFALSPLTGRLADRYGPRPVMIAGLVTLAAATALAAATGSLPLLRAAALFLLGYGWNLCFIGGSARLARDLPAVDRARIEGAVDSGIWSAAALASLVSTAVLAAGGYAVLAGAAGTLLVLPAVALARTRTAGAVP